MTKGTSAALVVAGNLSLDDTINPAGAMEAAPGGDALYAAVGAAMWGGDVELLTLAGEDYPEAYVERIGDLGIGVGGVRRVAGPTVHYRVEDDSAGTRTYTHLTDEDRLLATSPGATDYARALAAPEVGWLHLAAMPIEAQREGVEAARRAGVAVSIDPHEEEVVPGREILAAIVADSIFVPSELEVALLFPDLAEAHAGLELARAALPRLAEWRPRAVAIKLGAAGSLVWEADTTGDAVHVPALPVTVVDAIGAGDAYCGGFAAAWLATGSAVAAAACGSVAAARVIGQFGAFPPTWPEPVESLLDDARSLLRSSADERAAIDALDVMSEHRDAAAMAARR